MGDVKWGGGVGLGLPGRGKRVVGPNPEKQLFYSRFYKN